MDRSKTALYACFLWAPPPRFVFRLRTMASPGVTTGWQLGRSGQLWGLESQGPGSESTLPVTPGEGLGARHLSEGLRGAGSAAGTYQGVHECPGPPLWAGGERGGPAFWPGLYTSAGWAAFSRPLLGEQLRGPHSLRRQRPCELERTPLSFLPEGGHHPAPGPPRRLPSSLGVQTTAFRKTG